MKRIYVITALVILGLLWSCSQEAKTEETTLETNPTGIMAEELTGSIVLETNPHPLAGKTLNFDIEMMKITKSGSWTVEDTVEAGDDIEVHYTGTLENGEKFDSSLDRGETLPFTVGAGGMIAWFDSGVVGMKLWDKKTLVLPPEEAYGLSRPETVPKKDLASFVNAGIKLEVWEKLPTQFGELEIIEVIEE